jgi:hypothetical protein
MIRKIDKPFDRETQLGNISKTMTRQIRDRFIFSGEVYYLNQEILEGYFKEYPERKPKSQRRCTALWRGYIATFEIRENQLFVEKLEIIGDSLSDLKLVKDLFPNNNKFEWYSGLIRIDKCTGKRDDEKEEPIFEYLEIYKGNLIQKRRMNSEELQIFKKSQFEYFKTTEEYSKVYLSLKKKHPNLEAEKLDEYIYKDLLNKYSKEIFDNKTVN